MEIYLSAESYHKFENKMFPKKGHCIHLFTFIIIHFKPSDKLQVPLILLSTSQNFSCYRVTKFLFKAVIKTTKCFCNQQTAFTPELPITELER